MSENKEKTATLGSGMYVFILMVILALVKTFESSAGITWLTVLLPWIIWLAVKTFVGVINEAFGVD